MLVGVLAACGSDAGEGSGAPSSTTASSTSAAGSSRFSVETCCGGLAADVYLPDRPAGAQVPVVVLVHGGAWIGGDRYGLAPLATALAESGAVVVSTANRLDDAHYPTMVDDVVCATRFAASRARSAGYHPEAVVVAGHSSGGHLAALAALTPDEHGNGCTEAPVGVDGLVGLAGVYDVREAADIAEPFFGTALADDPDRWTEGNPVERAGERPELAVLLLHGEDDAAVPTSVTTAFAQALQEGGHRVETTLVPGEDHLGIFQPSVAAPPIEQFLASLTSRGG